MTFAPVNAQTAYLPIEFQIEGSEAYVRQLIAERERLTSSILNVKEIGQYETRELVTAQTWFNVNVTQASSMNTTRQPRYGFRKVFDMVVANGGPIPAATVVTLAHNITGITVPTRIFGSATTSTGKFYPLPFVDEALITNQIKLYADITNVVLTTGATIDGGANTLTQAYFVFEYLKT